MKIGAFSFIVVFLLVSTLAYALTESEKSKATVVVQKTSALGQASSEKTNSVTKINMTGLEWLRLSEKDQLDYIMSSMFILTNHGVIFTKTPVEYYYAVKERMRFNPDFYSANITNILASIIYEQEPDNRDAIDQIRQKPNIVQGTAL